MVLEKKKKNDYNMNILKIPYTNTKYSYLRINSKIKNEFSYIYEDKYLNDTIYVLNSNSNYNHFYYLCLSISITLLLL